MLTGRLDLLSSSGAGVPGDNSSDVIGSSSHVLSDDGRLAVFNSFATNLVPGDTNGLQDVFLKERLPDAPLTPGSTMLSIPAFAGTSTLQVLSNMGFRIGDRIVINQGKPDQEVDVVAGLGSIILQDPLRLNHAAGATVSLLPPGKGLLPPPAPFDAPPVAITPTMPPYKGP